MMVVRIEAGAFKLDDFPAEIEAIL